MVIKPSHPSSAQFRRPSSRDACANILFAHKSPSGRYLAM